MANPMKAYQRVRITTASPAELVVILFEGLVRFTLSGAEDIEDQRWGDVGSHISKAVELVGHLQESLAENVAPELVANLDRTYEAWTRCLLRGQLQRDAELLRTIASQMDDLLGAWRFAAQSVAAEARL